MLGPAGHTTSDVVKRSPPSSPYPKPSPPRLTGPGSGLPRPGRSGTARPAGSHRPASVVVAVTPWTSFDHQGRWQVPSGVHRRLLAVIERGERPGGTVATRRRDHDAELRPGPKRVDDRVDWDLDQGVCARCQRAGAGSEVGRIGEESRRVTSFGTVRAAQEARGHILLLVGGGSHLGDGDLEIQDRCRRLDLQVDGRRAHDRRRLGEGGGLERDGVGSRDGSPIPIRGRRPGVAGGGQARGGSHRGVEGERGTARSLAEPRC